MSTVLIVLLLVIALVVGLSLALGRSTYEVDSARDTEYLELEGAWVRYSVSGGGPPVVLVHGWMSSSVVWDQLASRLAQRFTVYTLDLTGFGESDKPLAGYGIRYGGRLLYAFCAHFGLTKVGIIGHDIGGDMAVKLASDHPDVVGRLVLVATPANEEQIDLPTPLWAATLPVVGPVFYALGKSVRPIRKLWMTPFVSEPSDVTEEMLEDAASTTPAAMSQTLTVSRREIAGGRLARQSRMIKVPALVIAGEEDQIVDPQAVGEWARSLDRSEVCLMDECGHMPMIERPGEFNAQILAFLTGDARYLEYAEQRPVETPVVRDDGDAVPGAVDVTEEEPLIPPVTPEPETETGMDTTRRFNIRPEEGEAPAFGVPPEETGADETPEAGPFETPVEQRPVRRRRGSRSEPDTSGPAFGAGSIFDDTERRERIDRSRFEQTGRSDEEYRDEEEPDSAIRRFGERFSARRNRRQEDHPEADYPVGDYSGGLDAGDDDREPGSHTEGVDFAGEPPDPGREPADEADNFDEDIRGAGAPLDDPAPERPSARRRRPRREDIGGSDPGDVPEVPPGLFDWGDSLDVFQPPTRDTRGGSDSGSRRDRSDTDPVEDHDDDPFDGPRGR